MQKLLVLLKSVVCWFIYDSLLRLGASAFDVRLVGGSTDYEGRVEVSYLGIWGTVCDDSWGEAETRVACRQLGYTGLDSEFFPSAYFGEGSGTVWLDNVDCLGSETSLGECSHRGWGAHNCGHHEDVGVRCSDGEGHGNVRLVGGSTSTEGRVEVFYNGLWGTICDDGWGLEEADVVCQQLGYIGANEAPGSATFGEGSGNVWLDDVLCSGVETSIEDCQHGGWGAHNCAHREDAGVRCNDDDGSVRLVGGSARYEGRVEIYHDSVWGTICDDHWGIEEGMIVCKELGYSSVLSVQSGAHFGQGTGEIWLDDVGCSGSEAGLDDCPHGGWGVHDCTHAEDAGVRCSPGTAENSIRLTNGHDMAGGRVEIYHNGAWGTVCDDDWSLQDAQVVCRQLGFPGTISSHSEAHFGRGTGEIWFDNVDCSGTESRLTSCRHNGWGSHNCNHGEDAGVTCRKETADSTGSVALVNDKGQNWWGRVEVFYNNTWGTVCSDLWSWNEAKVVCTSLGFDDVDKWMISADVSTGPIWLDNVQCDGTESSLVYCSHGGWGIHNCDHAQDVAVSCYNHSAFSTGRIIGILVGTVCLVILTQYLKRVHNKHRCCNHNTTSTTPTPTSTTSSHHHWVGPVTRDDGSGIGNPGFSGHYSRPDSAPPSYDSIYKYSAYPEPPPPDPEAFSPEGGTRSPPPPYLPPSSNLNTVTEEPPRSGSRNSYLSRTSPNTDFTMAPIN